MSRSFDSGFTLIELMVVLAVIAIMTALIIPEMRGTLEEARLRSSARSLVAACEAANSRAITHNQRQQLLLEIRTGGYTLRSGADGQPQQANGAGDDAPIEGQIDSHVAMQFETGDAMEVEADKTSAPASRREPSPQRRPAGISFYPDGTADPATIVLRDQEGFRLALQIQSITARVRLVELPRH